MTKPTPIKLRSEGADPESLPRQWDAPLSEAARHYIGERTTLDSKASRIVAIRDKIEPVFDMPSESSVVSMGELATQNMVSIIVTKIKEYESGKRLITNFTPSPNDFGLTKSETTVDLSEEEREALLIEIGQRIELLTERIEAKQKPAAFKNSGIIEESSEDDFFKISDSEIGPDLYSKDDISYWSKHFPKHLTLVEYQGGKITKEEFLTRLGYVGKEEK